MKKREGSVDYHSYVRVNSAVFKTTGEKTILTLDINNLSGLLIKKIIFSISAADDFEDPVLIDGQKCYRFAFENIALEPAMRLKLSVTLPIGEEPKRTELRAEEVTFEDGETAFWQKPRKKIYFYEEVEKDRYKDQVIYQKLCQYAANPVCFAEKRTDGWLCTCGRLNRNKDDLCLECMADRKTVLLQCTKESIKGEIKKEHEEYRRNLHLRREQEMRTRRNHLILAAALAVLAAAVLAGVYFYQWQRGKETRTENAALEKTEAFQENDGQRLAEVKIETVQNICYNK